MSSWRWAPLCIHSLLGAGEDPTASGEYEGSTQPAGQTRFGGIAIRIRNLVGALEIVP
jgi:hypothetical protein